MVNRRAVAAAVLAAALLRALPLLDNGFHPDEALYAYFGRLIASGRDPLLAQVVVDKPPLPFFLLAGSFSLFGGGEFAARLPSYFAGLLSVALIYALARRLYGGRTAALSAWLLALSPFAILFDITLFLDTLLTMLALWGWNQAAAGRARWVAAAFALAFMVKQTALVLLPVAVALDITAHARLDSLPATLRGLARRLGVVVLGLALAALAVFGWDALRLSLGAPISFWAQGFSDNAPNRLIRSGEVAVRARAWLDLVHYATASPALNLTLALGVPALLWACRRAPTRAALTDLALAGYLSAYLAAYWLLAFNVWDRYLVPASPLALILLARVVTRAADAAQRLNARAISFRVDAGRPGQARWSSASLLPVVAVLLMLPGAATAARSGYPIGGDHGAYAGLDTTARFLNALPEGAVLYDFWLSWQWNYYLFDSPVFVAWMPSPQALAADLQAFGRTSPRYLVVPSWESEAETRAAAAQAGFTLEPAHSAYRPDGSRSFVVYRFRALETGPP